MAKARKTSKAGERVKALEVLIDGISIGLFVPPSGDHFAFSLWSDSEKDSIVARVICGSSLEWSIPAVCFGQRISFRMIDSPAHDGPQAQVIQREIA